MEDYKRTSQKALTTILAVIGLLMLAALAGFLYGFFPPL